MATNRLAKSEAASRVKLTPEQIAAQGNFYIEKEGRTDIEWVVRDDKAQLRWKSLFTKSKRDLMDRRGESMSQWETDQLNRQLEGYGATARYRSDGSKFFIGETEQLADLA